MYPVMFWLWTTVVLISKALHQHMVPVLLLLLMSHVWTSLNKLKQAQVLICIMQHKSWSGKQTRFVSCVLFFVLLSMFAFVSFLVREDLFLVIHNIDGEMLRSSKVRYKGMLVPVRTRAGLYFVYISHRTLFVQQLKDPYVQWAKGPLCTTTKGPLCTVD